MVSFRITAFIVLVGLLTLTACPRAEAGCGRWWGYGWGDGYHSVLGSYEGHPYRVGPQQPEPYWYQANVDNGMVRRLPPAY